jgi:signal peptidase II
LRFKLVLFTTAVATIVVDRITKYWASHVLGIGHSTDFIGKYVLLTPIVNSGAAFGILTNATVVLAVVSVIATLAVIIAAFMIRRGTTFLAIALGLILGGAASNGFDRIFYGKVVDFINLRYWPVFNAADSAVTIGIIMLLIGFIYPKIIVKP